MSDFSSLLTPALLSGLSFFLISLGVLISVRLILVSRLKKWAKKTNAKIDDQVSKALDKIGWPVYVIVPLYIATQTTPLPEELKNRIGQFTLIIVIFYLVLAFQQFIGFFLKTLFKFQRSQGDELDKTISGIIIFLAKVVVWGFAILMILQNLGVNISALLGGVGIAGIAISFALQNILKDIFSFFTIYFDKPFAVGDYIDIGLESGTVERIGLKSTRIRTLQGQELVVSNSELTNVRIHNYRKLEKRRVVMTFDIAYGTSNKKLMQVPEIIATICKNIDQIEHSRTHLKTLGDSSLVFETVYHVLTKEYDIYMDAQQNLNLQLIEQLEKHKIELAFQAKQVFVKR